MTMNNPHVKAIYYLIDRDDSVDCRDVALMVLEDDVLASR